MVVKPDYYAILGARQDSSARDIERLYKRQAHRHHPDRGGAEDDMKALNEAYHVLGSAERRNAYDAERFVSKVSARETSGPARDVGLSGQLLSALLCILLGSMLLLLVRFNGLWFLWPLSILAVGVIFFGVMITHLAIRNARSRLVDAHPAKRFRVVQEVAFWALVISGGIIFYFILNSV